MSIFGQQLQNRIEKDEKMCTRNLHVLGEAAKGHYYKGTDDDLSPKQTVRQLERILQYLRIPLPENPPFSDDLNEQIDLVMQESGTVSREVELSDIWWKNGDGPLLAVIRETGEVKALIPGTFGGYFYEDHAGKRIRVTKDNKGQFELTAWCFYKPLPDRALTGVDFIRFLLRQLRVSDIVVFIIAMLFITLFGTITPAATTFAFSHVIHSGKEELLITLGILLLMTAVGTWLMTVVKNSMNNRISTRLDVVSENSVYARVLNLPADFFYGKSSGEIAQKVNALNQIPMMLGNIIFSCAVSAVMSLLYVAEIFLIAPSLSFPAFVIYVAELLVLLATVIQESNMVRRQLSGSEINSGVVFSFISGIQKIKISGSEKRAFSRWMESYAEKLRPSYSIRFPFSLRMPLLTAITLLGMLWIYVTAYSQGLSPAQFAGFSSAFGMAVAGINTIGNSGTLIASVRPILERGEEILKTVPEGREDKKSVRSLSGKIELSGVTFSYEEGGRQILKNLSLNVEPGEYVAIVGPSGCGKSTLLRILLGFETPQQGMVYYDNEDIENLNKRSLRRQIGTVLQNGNLLNGDIYSNITISSPRTDMDAAWEAAEKAGIAEDIRSMPMGMHTMISEGSGGISGGQKQRILIARAICGKPGILMFDEATSALDNLTQKIVTDSLNEMNCTRIVIAHRLSTIRECDRILVLSGGSIQEEGTFEELMKKDGLFAKLAARQLEEWT